MAYRPDPRRNLAHQEISRRPTSTSIHLVAVPMKPRIRLPMTSRYSTTTPASSNSYPPSTGPAPSKVRFIPSSGTYPKDFLVAGLHAGVKKNPHLLDLAVITSRKPINAAAVFTTNVFQAAPVVVSKRILDATGGSGLGGLVVNSGCANAVTGEGGMKDAESMAAALGGGNALVMSTGVIGQRLPIQKILDGIPVAVEKMGDSHQHWLDAATAFCTTDTFPKLLSREIQTEGGSYRIAGIAKGAGMIHPKYVAFAFSYSLNTCLETLTFVVWLRYYQVYLPMRQSPHHYSKASSLTP